MLVQLFSNTAGWEEVLRAPAAHGVSSRVFVNPKVYDTRASRPGLCIVPLNAERDSIMQLQSLMIEMHKFVSIVDCINSIC